MNFDMSFIRGNNTPIDTPSKPTEPHKGQSRKLKQTNPQNAAESLTAASTAEQLKLINTAREIVKEYKITREIAEGAMLQLEKDLAEGKDDLTVNLLFLTEALDRVTGGGDQFIFRAEKALRAAGHQI